MKRSLVSLPVLALLGVGVVTSAGAARATSPDAGEFNDADVAFAQGMIPHHEDAIEMADVALDPTSEASPEVVDLATRIQAAQGPEIELMTGWLEAWGQPLEPATSDGHEPASTERTQSSEVQTTGMTEGMDMCAMTDSMDVDMDTTAPTTGSEATEMTGMDSMMPGTDMMALDALTGEEFDHMWLCMMIDHHEGAISMSETEQADGLNAAAIELAGQIIEAQQAEIDEMNDLLGRGVATTDPPATTS